MSLIFKVTNYRAYFVYASSFNDEEEFKVFNLAFEYDGYSGDEKFALATDLTEEELRSKYGDEIVAFEPFVSLTREMGLIMTEQHKNNQKFRKRASRGQEVFVEDIDDEFYSSESAQAKNNIEIRDDLIIAAINKLSSKSRERIIKKFYLGKTAKEIASESGFDSSTVAKDIHKSLKTLEVLLKDMGVCA